MYICIRNLQFANSSTALCKSKVQPWLPRKSTPWGGMFSNAANKNGGPREEGAAVFVHLRTGRKKILMVNSGMERWN
jgi:hypothetical protein